MTSAARGRVSVIHIPFGRYRGRPITEVDNGYLHWLHEKLDEWQPSLREAIIAERARRKDLPSSDPAPAQASLVTPQPPPRRVPHREIAPPSATCARCGLGASVTRPLVHASCANDEVPF
jgi:putative quorum-sensing-regulated virulence factor